MAGKALACDAHRAHVILLNYACAPLEQFAQYLAVADINSLPAAVELTTSGGGGPALRTQEELAELLSVGSPLGYYLQAAHDGTWQRWALESST